jgi:hypothetical protein
MSASQPLEQEDGHCASPRLAYTSTNGRLTLSMTHRRHISLGVHTGTHLDSPAHFIREEYEAGNSVDKVSSEQAAVLSGGRTVTALTGKHASSYVLAIGTNSSCYCLCPR